MPYYLQNEGYRHNNLFGTFYLLQNNGFTIQLHRQHIYFVILLNQTILCALLPHTTQILIKMI